MTRVGGSSSGLARGASLGRIVEWETEDVNAPDIVDLLVALLVLQTINVFGASNMVHASFEQLNNEECP